MIEVRIALDPEIVTYFKTEAERLGVPYRTLLCLALRQFAAQGKRLDLDLRG
ncbi:MAG: hypothetical protein ACREYC_24400 [Gammaproteobacteria bacterium]